MTGQDFPNTAAASKNVSILQDQFCLFVIIEIEPKVPYMQSQNSITGPRTLLSKPAFLFEKWN